MKNSFKIGLLAMSIAFFAAGCSGCGDRGKAIPAEKIDTGNVKIDSPKSTIDTGKGKIDTAKKDTAKK